MNLQLSHFLFDSVLSLDVFLEASVDAVEVLVKPFTFAAAVCAEVFADVCVLEAFVFVLLVIEDAEESTASLL